MIELDWMVYLINCPILPYVRVHYTDLRSIINPRGLYLVFPSISDEFIINLRQEIVNYFASIT